ncbi:endopeptidase La [Flammeovirga kamogawensis]|uniref:Lon protease n=1 Tax=Flammeovirga kamogawensis TaxID=373891 RepID=A0ABX8GYQ8_9BACT|nr:endopeptidase La [Flammeovirga kamogawensis]MBB6458944.1 ATP-dependent Lon protease [Flammeovirga kamogawensis]QWG08519.1 endopeptidase La [Flammeovirga kamogawensis]TRX66812.1 endopeptidase La [Flammeovirga kamogawensis]
MRSKDTLAQGLLSNINNDAIISVIADDETESYNLDNIEELEVPILPLRNMVLFPNVLIPITIGREKSNKLVEHAYSNKKFIAVVAQRDASVEDPAKKDLYQFGTLVQIIKILKLPDGNSTIIAQGRKKIELKELTSEEPFLSGQVVIHEEDFSKIKKTEEKALESSLRDVAYEILSLNRDIPQEASLALENIKGLDFLANFIATNINAEVNDKQKILRISDGKVKVERLLKLMNKEVNLLEIKNEIAGKTNVDIDQQQRDYYLRQQMKVLQTELGAEGPDEEIAALKERAEKKDWPDNVKDHFYKELAKLMRSNPAAADFAVSMNYCEFMLDLPWNKITEDSFDLKNAQKILDKDHQGLEKVKERILEYLAVLKLKNDIKGPILCLYGPPGVGKTSLGRSIAKALGREYNRISLGGLHDETEIRGHRKTYVGAMPGKIMQSIKKSGVSNPVFILDEIDKIGNDFRGDPSSAFLEVLDPEQNNAFTDNYLEVEYDLSKVLFIATANSLDTIQPALRDRMEIIEITGYTFEEKEEIAKKHLIPKQRTEHGLKAKDFTISAKGLKFLIENYTRESGVRGLERTIGSVIRKVAKSIAMEEEYKKSIGPDEVIKYLGAPIFERETYQDNEYAGVVTGLAWTQVGGEILFIESSLNKGKGRLTLSGQLGDVMKESATTALSWLKANADKYGIDHRVFETYDLHIHVPAGAVPKDGPSAGITMLTSMVSTYTQRKIKSKLAMTGEITLRGKVLPVGGIKEKLLAAKRAGIKEIIFSERNQRDVKDIPEKYTDGLKLNFVKDAKEVLEIALMKTKVDDPINFEFPKEK